MLTRLQLIIAVLRPADLATSPFLVVRSRSHQLGERHRGGMCRGSSGRGRRCGFLDRAGAPARRRRPQGGWGRTTRVGRGGGLSRRWAGRAAPGARRSIWRSDGGGRPLALPVTGGQVADTTQLERGLALVHVPRAGPGRPRSRPARVIADNGYSSRTNRRHLRRRGIGAVIPERDDQLANRRRSGRTGGHPYDFDVEVYRTATATSSNAASTASKQWRGLATRYHKTATNYVGGLQLASVIMWADDPVHSGDTPYRPQSNRNTTTTALPPLSRIENRRRNSPPPRIITLRDAVPGKIGSQPLLPGCAYPPDVVRSAGIRHHGVDGRTPDKVGAWRLSAERSY